MKLGANIDMAKIVKNLGQKFKLVPHLDLAIGEGEFEWHFDYKAKVEDDAWHPSGDCTPSLRALYLKAAGQLEPESISPGLRKIFMVGHFYHQYLQWVVEHKLGFAGPADIERTGRRVWGEVAAGVPAMGTTVPGRPLSGDVLMVKPYHWVTGSADIAPCRIPGEGEFLVDFKTVNPRMYATGMNPDYLAKWECQGNIYLDFFDMERALFVLIDKSNGDMKEMEFQRNQPLIDALYLKWHLVSECLDEGIEPPEGEDIDLPLNGPIS